jgi:Mn-dependent DtxR family transcriptional regulator
LNYIQTESKYYKLIKIKNIIYESLRRRHRLLQDLFHDLLNFTKGEENYKKKDKHHVLVSNFDHVAFILAKQTSKKKEMFWLC